MVGAARPGDGLQRRRKTGGGGDRAPATPTAYRSAAFMPLRTTEPSMPSCPGYRPRAREDGRRSAQIWTNVRCPQASVEIEVARRLLLEPEAVVLGRVLEEVGRVLKHVLVVLVVLVLVVQLREVVVIVELDVVVIVGREIVLVLVVLEAVLLGVGELCAWRGRRGRLDLGCRRLEHGRLRYVDLLGNGVAGV